MVIMGESELVKNKIAIFFTFGCKLRLAGRHYTFGVVFFAELIR